MALTKITKGVIKPNENYDTHNINSTGIVTANSFVGNVSGDATGLTGTPNLNVGIVTATEFHGDGSNLTGVGGLGDGVGSTNNLNYLFTSPELLELTASATVSATQAQGKVVFTASDSVKVATGVTVTVAAGTTIRTNVLGLY